MSLWRRIRRWLNPILGESLADALDAIDRKWALEEARLLAACDAEAARDKARWLRFEDQFETWVRTGGKSDPPNLEPRWKN